MINNQEIKTKLDNQTNLILDIISTVEYLVNYPNYLKFINSENLRDLGFINKILSDYTILILNELFNNSEEYSFNKLISLIQKDYTEKVDFEKLKKQLKKANKFFKSLDVIYIRNKHVAHLDPTRETRTINWLEVKELINLACDIHNSINLMIFEEESEWNFDKEVLNNLYSNHLLRNKLYEKKKEMYDMGRNEINISEIEKIIKASWQ